MRINSLSFTEIYEGKVLACVLSFYYSILVKTLINIPIIYDNNGIEIRINSNDGLIETPAAAKFGGSRTKAGSPNRRMVLDHELVR